MANSKNDAEPRAGRKLPGLVVRMLFLSLLVVSCAAFQGCAHQVIIDSEPSGAHIVVDGIDFGEGPVSIEERTGWEEVHQVTLEKEGYRRQRTLIKQSEWNDPLVVMFVCGFLSCAWTGIGLFSLAGLGFARQLPDRVVIPLEPLSSEPKKKPTPGKNEKRAIVPPNTAPDE
ncbi:MAG: PEGA domain-containing protein [Deltaproteobacteria bacterium]|nr:PEGA domain-containing protein [Deltaproteobacteria bacterium]